MNIKEVTKGFRWSYSSCEYTNEEGRTPLAFGPGNKLGMRADGKKTPRINNYEFAKTMLGLVAKNAKGETDEDHEKDADAPAGAPRYFVEDIIRYYYPWMSLTQVKNRVSRANKFLGEAGATYTALSLKNAGKSSGKPKKKTAYEDIISELGDFAGLTIGKTKLRKAQRLERSADQKKQARKEYNQTKLIEMGLMPANYSSQSEFLSAFYRNDGSQKLQDNFLDMLCAKKGPYSSYEQEDVAPWLVSWWKSETNG